MGAACDGGCDRRLRERDIANLPEDIEAVVYSQHRASCECRKCGRYVGALEVCPFCRHFNRKRLSILLLKYLTPILTVVGIALLFKLGASRGNPEVKIEALGRRTNFAQVRVEGSVEESPRFYRSQASEAPGAGSLEFSVDDGTGVLKIRAYEDATVELVRTGAIPGAGDRVAILGTYQYKAKADFLILGSAAALKIHAPVAEEVTPLDHLVRPGSRLKSGTRVRIVGKVRDTRLGQFSWEMSVVDEKQNELRVELSDSILDLYGLKKGDALEWPDAPGPGDIVSVDGTLAWSRFDKGWMVEVSSPHKLEKVKSTP
jgi:hypothetical protein